MNNLTQRMLDDYKPFYFRKDRWEGASRSMEDRWEGALNSMLRFVEMWGDIVRIEDVYYPPPNDAQLKERRYITASGRSRVIEAFRAVDDGEELILAPIPDLIVEEPAVFTAEREPARMAAMA